MNKEEKRLFLNKWTAALRSGKYRQGKNKLYIKENDSFCCLGVASVILGANKESISPFSYPGVLGISLPIFINIQYELAVLNDGGVSFRAIADKIEDVCY